eukprot:scaffold85956_cov66-Phaeocystis_antarctica.AAC.1
MSHSERFPDSVDCALRDLGKVWVLYCDLNIAPLHVHNRVITHSGLTWYAESVAALICYHLSCTPSPDTFVLTAPPGVPPTRHGNTRNQGPLYSQWSARSPAHGPSQASLADTALWLWPMRMRGHSGSEQVLYAYGPPHSIRDALVVFIAHLRRGGMVGVSCGRGGGEDFRAGLSEGCGQGERRGRGRAE